MVGLAQKAVSALGTVLHWAYVSARRERFRVRRAPAPEIDAIVDEIRREGIACLPDFLSPSDCATLRDWIDDETSRRYRERPWIKERGIIGAETMHPLIGDFYRSALPHATAEAILANRMIPAFTEASKIVARPDARRSYSGWHRDTLFRELKAIVYLSDVEEEDGAFEYLPGSLSLGNVLGDINQIGLRYPERHLNEEQIDRLIESGRYTPRIVCAPAGTLLLCNTAALHRRRACRGRSRYSLTNSYFETFNYTPQRMARYGAPFRPRLLQNVDPATVLTETR